MTHSNRNSFKTCTMLMDGFTASIKEMDCRTLRVHVLISAGDYWWLIRGTPEGQWAGICLNIIRVSLCVLI